jgi:ABC-type cobalamin/Fe3+-siderophores transport system ATPase subunit
MAINRVEIKDYLVFKGVFTADFCPGVNVLIGGNGTGKTTLIKCLYEIKRPYVAVFKTEGMKPAAAFGDNNMLIIAGIEPGEKMCVWGTAFIDKTAKNFIYIPEKDILEHAKGLLTFIEQKQTGFG